MIGFLKRLLDPTFYYRLPERIKFHLNRFYHEKFVFRIASKENIFTSIWRNNYWGNSESLSGMGSTLDQTAMLRKMIPGLFHEFKIKSVFDAPCGDMNWMHLLLEKANFRYLGGDIVGKIIEQNNARFQKQNVNFVQFDITSDIFPEADVWLCRHVLFHLSNSDIYSALEKFSESNIKYILTTNCTTDCDHINKDIATGSWRLLNLRLPPFNFPKASLWEIDDYVNPAPPMTLALWTREQIIELLPNLRNAI